MGKSVASYSVIVDRHLESRISPLHLSLASPPFAVYNVVLNRAICGLSVAMLEQKEAALSAMKISAGSDAKTVMISSPRVTKETFSLSIPEFHGKEEDSPYAIREVLEVKEVEKDAKLRFQLSGKPSEVGIEFKGKATAHEDEVRIEAKLRNIRNNPIHFGHHSLLLDFSDAPSFDDRTGERTFLYAETGWASIAQLLDPLHTKQHTIHVGASHKGITVMWKMIARFDATRRTIVALALDKGYVFASDHPDWGRSLLGGYRWGSVNAQETKPMTGRIYLFRGTLDDLRRHYMKDFK